MVWIVVYLMKVLIACEFSGIVREAFKEKGHDAWSCDLLPTEIPGQHRQEDVTTVLQEPWDLVIAHPPCTRLANLGVRWLHERDLWDDMKKDAEFFVLCLNANAPMVAVENPIPHKYAVEIIGRKYDFTVQPYEHGDPYTKRTCFWVKNLPPLVPTNIVEERYPKSWLESPSPDRWKNRSRTYPGIAKAMADQWG